MIIYLSTKERDNKNHRSLEVRQQGPTRAEVNYSDERRRIIQRSLVHAILDSWSLVITYGGIFISGDWSIPCVINQDVAASIRGQDRVR